MNCIHSFSNFPPLAFFRILETIFYLAVKIVSNILKKAKDQKFINLKAQKYYTDLSLR